mgnify:CR=1 FL=1
MSGAVGKPIQGPFSLDCCQGSDWGVVMEGNDHFERIGSHGGDKASIGYSAEKSMDGGRVH